MLDHLKRKFKMPEALKRPWVVLLFVFGISLLSAHAQNILVKGVITDAESNEPLPGVNIVIEGTTTGVISDFDGKYQISTSKDAVLIFSFMGYQTIKIPVEGKIEINVRLTPDTKSLDEIVVVGYGTIRKKDLTGVVSSVTEQTLKDIPVASVAEAITGKLAGVQITTTDGSPDAEIVIRVRGGGSVTQDNSPLYIVDGFPVSNINDIPPTDIASIDVLKDASTAAIYGARGANGVIIITTKKPKEGKTSISYNGYIQRKYFPKEMEVLSPYEFVLAQYEYYKLRDPNGEGELKNFTKLFGVYDDLELYKSQRGINWQQELFGEPKWSRYHNLNINGGTEKSKISLSITNNKDQGLLLYSGYERTNINFKLDNQLYKTLRFEVNSRFSNTEVDGAGTSGSSNLRVADAITRRPVNGLVDVYEMDEGDLDDDFENFIRNLVDPRELAADDYRKKITKTFNMNAALSWTIIKGLVFRSEFGAQYTFLENKRYYGPLTSTSRNEGNNLPLGEITKTQEPNFRITNTLSYKKKFGGIHSLDLLAGQEVLISKYSSQYLRAKEFSESIEPEKLFANMALGVGDRFSTYVKPDENLASFFGRANYSYADKYLFTVTMRADGSSKFAPGNQWAFFPAAAVAWRISEEEFAKYIKFISNLKVRASYGEAGNDRIPPNSFTQTYKTSLTRPIGFNEGLHSYYVPGTSFLINPNLKWETTVTRNAGLDFGVFNDRLNGTIDFYWNTTKDLLVESDIPSYLGYSKQMRNIGQTSNKGVEITMNGFIIQKTDFTLSASFNIGFNKNTIDKLDEVNSKPIYSNWASTDLVSQDDYRIEVGQTVGLIYGYELDGKGYYTVDDFERYDTIAKKYILKPGIADNSSLIGGTLRPGMMKLKDQNGDTLINSEKDRVVIGNANPKHVGGFNINATYKGFDLALYFNWKYGNDVYNTGRISYNMYYRTSYGNMLNTMNYEDRFKYIDENGNLVVNDLEALRELNKDAKIWSPFSTGTAKPVLTNYAIEDGSFLRLNNVTLGYTLPNKLSSKVLIQQLRVYGTLYNIWKWTNYSGYDPEVSVTRSSSYNSLTPGVDYSAYPKSFSWTLGVNITF